jgi:hypothetical protein
VIAFSRASLLLALAVRKRCLSLDHAFSIGFRSGEYGGRYSKWAPASSMCCRIGGTLCEAKLSITTTSPGCSAGHNTCATKASKMSLSVASSMVMAATIPRTLMAPKMVRIFQRPAGAPSPMRPPPTPRARRRVIDVVTPLSSRKISLSGGIEPICARYSWRRRRLAALSRSAAWSDFFSVAGLTAEAETKSVEG